MVAHNRANPGLWVASARDITTRERVAVGQAEQLAFWVHLGLPRVVPVLSVHVLSGWPYFYVLKLSFHFSPMNWEV